VQSRYVNRINSPVGLFGAGYTWGSRALGGGGERPAARSSSETTTCFPGQPQKLFETPTCEKQLLAVTGGAAHCQMEGLTLFHQRLFDWLDDVVKPLN
jgi:hypothetical protein